MSRRPVPLAATLVLAMTLAAARVGAEPEPPGEIDRHSKTIEIWTAMGSGDLMAEGGFRNAEFIFMTGVLGLVRFAPFVAGVAFDMGSQEEDNHVLLGPLFGIGLDITPGLRVESVVELGAHWVDGIGYKYAFEDGATGEESTWLLQGGLRIGLSGRIGRESPRVVIGGWVAAYRDLTTTTETITYSETDGGGSETWEVGGSIALLAVRLGFEW